MKGTPGLHPVYVAFHLDWRLQLKIIVTIRLILSVTNIHRLGFFTLSKQGYGDRIQHWTCHRIVMEHQCFLGGVEMVLKVIRKD